MKLPFNWDYNSDQPYQLKDRAFKKQMRLNEWFSLTKTLLLSLIMIPFSIIAIPYAKRKEISAKRFFGMSVNLDKETLQNPQNKLIDELNVNDILIRFPLWEMDKISEYKNFVQSFKNKNITLNIMQDREHIEDLELLKKDLDLIFSVFESSVIRFQIGSTINRAKWGFFSVNEYLKFYEVAYQLKIEKYKTLELIGSGVIDFEYHYTIHSLFNLFKIKYDGVAGLLYVDRRGAPENAQMGFNLSDKIALLYSMTSLSKKSTNRLYITETNWPISNTAPFAPTSETECVDEDSYKNYMLRYYILAFASQQVDTVFWHQLIAPGYGLIDNRDNNSKKRAAFKAFKFLVSILNEAQFLRLDEKRGLYTFQCLTEDGLVHICWATKEQRAYFYDGMSYHDSLGKKRNADKLRVGSEPLYFNMGK